MNKNNKNIIVIINPKFNKPEIFEIKTNFKYLLLGPIAAIHEGFYFSAFIHFTLSVLTLGVFWIYYAEKVNIIELRRKISMGFTPATDKDWEKIKPLLGKDFEIEGFKFQRLGSLDSKYKINLDRDK